MKWRPSARAQLAQVRRDLAQERLKSAVLQRRTERLEGELRTLEFRQQRGASIDPDRVVRLQVEHVVSTLVVRQQDMAQMIDDTRQGMTARLAHAATEHVRITAHPSVSFGAGSIVLRGVLDVLKPDVIPDADAFGLPLPDRLYPPMPPMPPRRPVAFP